MSNIYNGFLTYIYDFCPYFGRDKSKMAKHYISMLERLPSRTVLELGTATGVLSLALLEAGLFVDTVDYSWDMQLAAKSKLNHFEENIQNRIHFILSDVTMFQPSKKYGAIMIPDSLLTVIQEDQWKPLLKSCYDALENDGVLLFDMYKPLDIKDERYTDATRFRDDNHNVYIVEVNHEIFPQKQLQKSDYCYRKRLSFHRYIDAARITINYHYKYLYQIVEALKALGFVNIESKEIFDGQIYFISAYKSDNKTSFGRKDL